MGGMEVVEAITGFSPTTLFDLVGDPICGDLVRSLHCLHYLHFFTINERQKVAEVKANGG